MPDNNPTPQPSATTTPAVTPTPAPPPQPDPMTVLAPQPPMNQPEEHTALHKAAMVLLAVLLVVAVGVAVWQFVPLPGPQTPHSAAIYDPAQTDAALGQVDAAFDDLDANMAGLDPALNDVQGSLSE